MIVYKENKIRFSKGYRGNVYILGSLEDIPTFHNSNLITLKSRKLHSQIHTKLP